MVVQDLDGGRVSTVTYASKDPITKTLKGFAIDLTTNPTMAQLLQQLRGERVMVEAPNELTGVILGVETRKVKLGDHETTETSRAQSLDRPGPSRRFARHGRPHQAGQRTTRRRTAQGAGGAGLGPLERQEVGRGEFSGKGTRHVRMGYIQAAPIWKTTYRLVLADEQKPLLQGWAIVENTSEEDWNNVDLTLVSGRPISFTMDLYQPLYMPRPEVQLELYSSLLPQLHGQDLVRKETEFAAPGGWRRRRS